MGNESTVDLIMEKTGDLLNETTPSQRAGVCTIGAICWTSVGYTVYRIVRGIVKTAKK